MKQYLYAGRLERLFAHLIDVLILLAFTTLFLGGLTPGMGALFSFFCNAVYYVFFLSTEWQATPGQRMLSMYVVRLNGRRIDTKSALLRFLAYVMPSLPLYSSLFAKDISEAITGALLVFWFAPILFTPDRAGIHDQLSEMRVIMGKPDEKTETAMSDLSVQLANIGAAARKAASVVALASTDARSNALSKAADAIRAHKDAILSANRADMDGAKDLSEAMRDRLMLNEARIEAMAAAVAAVAKLPDPVGHVLEAWDVAHNGLHIEKILVPLGVIGIIYESRPNVTADAAALCIKSGNAAILRCGSESLRSSLAIAEALHEGLKAAGLPKEAVQLIPTADREAVGIMMGMVGMIDILVPRGGKSLTERVQKESRVPSIQHLEGNCHTYIHSKAELKIAIAVTHNAKLRRTGICGATESLLIDKTVLASHGAPIIKDLLDGGCEVRGDKDIQALDAHVKPAKEEDWSTEYLAPVLSAKVVSGLDEALAHIARYGSHHTDAIITEDKETAARFTREVDSAIVLVNASTQFADGGEFGFGGEIGISTGRLHARGPVGAAQLVTYKYIVTTKKAGGAIRAG